LDIGQRMEASGPGEEAAQAQIAFANARSSKVAQLIRFVMVAFRWSIDLEPAQIASNRSKK
jgi:hypothetical protein